MAFSALGLVLGAALSENLKDQKQRTMIELLGGALGATPTGLVLVTVLAKQAAAQDTTPALPPAGTAAPTETQVPDVSAAGSIADATALLLTRGLTVAGTEPVISDQAIDTILGSSPEAGSVVSVGTAVTILVSAGLKVPDVTSQKVSDAEKVLAQFGFGHDVQSTDTQGPEDTVITQDPAGGTFASAGDTVTLFVFKPSLVAGRTRRTQHAEMKSG